MPVPPALPTLSVVLAETHDSNLAREVRQLAYVPVPKGTQFIVASASEEPESGAAAAAASRGRWLVIREPGASLAALRRAAMRVAIGDIVLFATPGEAEPQLRRLIRARDALASPHEILIEP